MDTTPSSFTARNNAKRAADRNTTPAGTLSGIASALHRPAAVNKAPSQPRQFALVSALRGEC